MFNLGIFNELTFSMLEIFNLHTYLRLKTSILSLGMLSWTLTTSPLLTCTLPSITEEECMVLMILMPDRATWPASTVRSPEISMAPLQHRQVTIKYSSHKINKSR